MKKTAFILILFLLTGLTIGFAGKPEPKSKSANQVTLDIQNKLRYPAFASEQKLEGEVWVSFKINEKGRIEILEANSVEPAIKEDVLKQLKKLKVKKGTFYPNEVHAMDVKFKLVE